MEAVNKRIHMEREKSREKMIKRYNFGLKDKANLSDDSINNETSTNT